MESILEGKKILIVTAYSLTGLFPFWKRKIISGKLETAETDADLVSISSEVFGLLVLETHFDRWLDIYKKCGGGIGIREYKMPKDIISAVQPRYTRGGLKNGKFRQIEIGKGWNMEGIFHFNKLIQFVRQEWFKILIL